MAERDEGQHADGVDGGPGEVPSSGADDGRAGVAGKRTGAGAAKRRLSRAAKPSGRPARRKARRKPVRWSAKREAAFLAALAESSNVAMSLRTSGLGETAVYRRRAHYAEFAAKWSAALREGYLKLEGEMLGRALAGVEKPVWHGGKQIGTVTEYNDRTALALLNAHRASVIGTRDAPATVPIEELRTRLKARLGEMNRRMGGDG